MALAEQAKAAQAEDAAVRAAMAALGLDDDAPPPTTEEEKQRYLTRQLQLGEQFLNQGKRRFIIGRPAHFKAAATCLFKALQVYPDPVKLLMAFQETVPPPVLDMVVQMMAADVENAKKDQEKIQEILD
ncbi:hypothetical protein HK100_009874 [Physocladia obscura]|uniref:Uncharacterized protein n=1 Tax=Physocladia obscura TaxID=109957 RepID=A0AAD5T4N9_9FUNG|nr:hypothetical protein HK100_009874 [Physocladia obscura]